MTDQEEACILSNITGLKWPDIIFKGDGKLYLHKPGTPYYAEFYVLWQPKYDIAQAMMVVEALRAEGYNVKLWASATSALIDIGWLCEMQRSAADYFRGDGDELTAAICAAAIKTVGKEE